MSPCDERLRGLFSYPRFRGEHYGRVLSDLKHLGVVSIERLGRQDLGEMSVLGKGCVGLVVAGRVGNKRVAVKILRADANRADLRGEAANLREANAVGVGPALYGEGEIVLVMEYIEGDFLTEWLKGPQPKEGAVHVLRSLLDQCRRLDSAGLDHGELSDAKRHVIVDRRGAPFIIDFETASRSRTCRNLTAMVNYLFFKESVAMLTGRFLCLEREALRDALRDYKREPSDEAYGRLIALTGL